MHIGTNISTENSFKKKKKKNTRYEAFAAAVRNEPLKPHPSPDGLGDDCGYSFEYAGKSGVAVVTSQVSGGAAGAGVVQDGTEPVQGFYAPTLEQFHKDLMAVWQCTSNKASNTFSHRR